MEKLATVLEVDNKKSSERLADALLGSMDWRTLNNFDGEPVASNTREASDYLAEQQAKKQAEDAIAVVPFLQEYGYGYDKPVVHGPANVRERLMDPNDSLRADALLVAYLNDLRRRGVEVDDETMVAAGPPLSSGLSDGEQQRLLLPIRMALELVGTNPTSAAGDNLGRIATAVVVEGPTSVTSKPVGGWQKSGDHGSYGLAA